MTDICSKQDWKLFRERVPQWQERYMEKLIREYTAILQEDSLASERFWKLHKRMRDDRQSLGVQIQMRKSDMMRIILAMLSEQIITAEDLQEFSDDLKNTVQLFQSRYFEEQVR